MIVISFGKSLCIKELYCAVDYLLLSAWNPKAVICTFDLGQSCSELLCKAPRLHHRDGLVGVAMDHRQLRHTGQQSWNT